MRTDDTLEFLDLILLDDEVREAFERLEKEHGVQMYGDLPYPWHLINTARIGYDYGFIFRTWILAALYHDSVEDTRITNEQIAGWHGSTVAALVDAVTGCNGNREEHCREQYAKIDKLPAAANIKCWDRLGHLTELAETWEDNPKKYSRLARMYLGEHEAFLQMAEGKVSARVISDLREAAENLGELLERHDRLAA